jgi:DNA polymerase-4
MIGMVFINKWINEPHICRHLFGCVTVKLRYSNFETFTKQQSISYTTADQVLFKTAKELFKRLYDRRMLIRMLGIQFTNLIPGNYQIYLFEDIQEMIKLYQAIDSAKKRFEEAMVVKAGGYEINSN